MVVNEINLSADPSYADVTLSKTLYPPSCSPVRHEDWTDAYGDTCSWYKEFDSPGCPNYGDLWDGGNGTPKEACCYCGGGNDSHGSDIPTKLPMKSPMKSPTDAPTNEPTSNPVQSPVQSPSPDQNTCTGIASKAKCNRTQGCGYNLFKAQCLDALSTEECSAFNGKGSKCRKNGCSSSRSITNFVREDGIEDQTNKSEFEPSASEIVSREK